MTPAELRKALDRVRARSSENCKAFIAAGRGNERPSDYLGLSDPLSIEAREISDRHCEIVREIEKRWGPSWAQYGLIPTKSRTSKKAFDRGR